MSHPTSAWIMKLETTRPSLGCMRGPARKLCRLPVPGLSPHAEQSGGLQMFHQKCAEGARGAVHHTVTAATASVAVALQHSAFEIIIEDDLRDPGPCLKSLDMAAQKVLHAGIEEEAQEDLARIAQHHDEGHQRTACAADHEMTEVCPV